MPDHSSSDTPRNSPFDPPSPRAQRLLASLSIQVRLYSVFAFLFILVIGLGVFGFARLGDVNLASEVIRDHWLRDTRILGDLSNYMSDYRAAEATRLLASTPQEFAASEQEIATLRATVSASQRAYEEISQDPSEAALYAEFAAQWADYQAVASQVLTLARAGRIADAVVLYNTGSRRAFDLSSDILSRLTDQTVQKAHRDGDRATSTYRHARNMVVTAMLLAVALLVGVIIYITRGILSPLLRLVHCMHALASQDTEITIPGVERLDEIGAMARAVAVFGAGGGTREREALDHPAAGFHQHDVARIPHSADDHRWTRAAPDQDERPARCGRHS
jgi:HAMP domain-containing protein